MTDRSRNARQRHTPAATGVYATPSPPTGYLVTVSRLQVAPLLEAYTKRQVRDASDSTSLEATTSADLGLSMISVALTDGGIRYSPGELLTWDDARRINAAPNQCFTVADGAVEPIALFSPTSNTLRSLMPTSGAPTMLVSGFSMHRIKGTEPWADTVAKAQAAAPLTGRVLDTTTGLGYTAILAARTASEVVTVELDPTGLQIARRNPWSHELFDRPNVQRIVGDAFEVVAEQREGSFDRIIHDPPYLTLAGDLYSEEMYRRLFRALRTGGRLFHYIGDPQSASGARTTAGVIRRLEAAGFHRVTRRPEAFGVTAVK
ncbi:MAG TPA: methyltransferase domain-containing protein [Ktedonobacterales bacterium]|nr:methyltransferase domain-containing protein [Ktedonobacterales bacterium]